MLRKENNFVLSRRHFNWITLSGTAALGLGSSLFPVGKIQHLIHQFNSPANQDLAILKSPRLIFIGGLRSNEILAASLTHALRAQQDQDLYLLNPLIIQTSERSWHFAHCGGFDYDRSLAQRQVKKYKSVKKLWENSSSVILKTSYSQIAPETLQLLRQDGFQPVFVHRHNLDDILQSELVYQRTKVAFQSLDESPLRIPPSHLSKAELKSALSEISWFARARAAHPDIPTLPSELFETQVGADRIGSVLRRSPRQVADLIQKKASSITRDSQALIEKSRA